MRLIAAELREKSIAELDEMIVEYKNNCLRLRQQKNTESIKPHELRTARRNVAIIMTVRTEKKMIEQFEIHKNDKRLPKDLRPKLTKAKRMALTKKQLNKKVYKIRARERKFPKVYYSYAE